MTTSYFPHFESLTQTLRDIQQPPADATERISGRARRLYEAAKRRSWNATVDLSWPDELMTDTAPAAGDGVLTGFAPFEALSLSQRTDIQWRLHALEINDILHGEQAAMLLASQLVTSLPDAAGRMFATSQAADEARHVEFFARYLQLIQNFLPDGRVQPPTPALATLILASLNESTWEMKLITCQVLIESIALARFQEIRQTSQIPFLRVGLARVLRDEARHTDFGTTQLRHHIESLPADVRVARSQYVLDQATRLIHSDAPIGDLAQRHG